MHPHRLLQFGCHKRLPVLTKRFLEHHKAPVFSSRYFTITGVYNDTPFFAPQSLRLRDKSPEPERHPMESRFLRCLAIHCPAEFDPAIRRPTRSSFLQPGILRGSFLCLLWLIPHSRLQQPDLFYNLRQLVAVRRANTYKRQPVVLLDESHHRESGLYGNRI
jgi:hypothetical protein